MWPDHVAGWRRRLTYLFYSTVASKIAINSRRVFTPNRIQFRRFLADAACSEVPQSL
jgi:hypothetical protein